MYGHGGFLNSDSSAAVFCHTYPRTLHLSFPCFPPKLHDNFGNLADPGGSQWVPF
jgi:hypothetical protein